jgi:hypothetical protein
MGHHHKQLNHNCSPTSDLEVFTNLSDKAHYLEPTYLLLALPPHNARTELPSFLGFAPEAHDILRPGGLDG